MKEPKTIEEINNNFTTPQANTYATLCIGATPSFTSNSSNGVTSPIVSNSSKPVFPDPTNTSPYLRSEVTSPSTSNSSTSLPYMRTSAHMATETVTETVTKTVAELPTVTIYEYAEKVEDKNRAAAAPSCSFVCAIFACIMLIGGLLVYWFKVIGKAGLKTGKKVLHNAF